MLCSLKSKKILKASKIKRKHERNEKNYNNNYTTSLNEEVEQPV